MAMIPCKHCNRDISDMATICPHCGAKTERGIKSSAETLKLIGIIVDVVAVILIFWAVFEFIGDISKYNDNNWWNGGYNYQSPLTDHEKGVLGRFGIGAFLAILSSTLITVAKSAENSATSSHNSASSSRSSTASSHTDSAFSSYAYSKEANTSGSGWKCVCGQTNANYVGTCSCGRSRRDVERAAMPQNTSVAAPSSAAEVKAEVTKAEVKTDTMHSQLDGIEAIKAYKELLDIGVITQEDFDKKKKELLGI